MTLAFSQACENNKQPILAKLEQEFAHSNSVLEIGSGTGQHAVYFAEHLAHLHWYTSDLSVNHSAIEQRIATASLANLSSPLALDLALPWQPILQSTNSPQTFDAIFTANTLHIVSWHLVETFFHQVAQHLARSGKLCIYGPFNYHGKFTSDSNARFDLWLKERDKHSGVRDFEQIIALAKLAQLTLVKDHTMPANNRLLVFMKQ